MMFIVARKHLSARIKSVELSSLIYDRCAFHDGLLIGRMTSKIYDEKAYLYKWVIRMLKYRYVFCVYQNKNVFLNMYEYIPGKLFLCLNQSGFVPGTKLNHGDFILFNCLRASPQQNIPYKHGTI